MDKYGAITWIHVIYKIAPLKTVIEAYLLIKWLPSIIKRRFLPVNTAISRLIDSSPSVMN